ncbi:MAG: anthranilate phosphoribosyltransferase [Alphaproteobacteria bacterium]
MTYFPGHALSEAEMMEAMETIISGKAPDEDIGAFLIALAQRRETVEEVTGAAQYLRERSVKIKAPAGAVDCCSTGGDGKHTYNISTAVALVAASCGVPMAKHGNRAASSKCGAADVLEKCGVNLELPVPKLEDALEKFNFAFLMAPQHHPAMARVREIRKKIGRRTIFNMLGPLLNPAGAKIQLVGVYDKTLLPVMAEALQRLGSEKAWIVHGMDGMDEITLGGFTHRAVLENNTVRQDRLAPEDFKLPPHLSDDLAGGEAKENAAALINVLKSEKNSYRNSVLANAAAVLVLHGTAAHLKEGVVKAAQAIDSGAALNTLNLYIEFSRGPA